MHKLAIQLGCPSPPTERKKGKEAFSGLCQRSLALCKYQCISSGTHCEDAVSRTEPTEAVPEGDIMISIEVLTSAKQMLPARQLTRFVLNN